MIHTILYLCVLLPLSLFTANRESFKAIASLCLLFTTDVVLSGSLNLAANDLLFFSTKALFDLVLIRLVSLFALSKIKQYTLYLCCVISFFINIYLCFEKGAVFVYTYWEDINLLLTEVMMLVLLICKKEDRMFNNIKVWIYGAVAALVMFLFGWLKVLSKQKEELKKDLQIAEQNVVVLETKQSADKEIQKVVNKIQHEGKVIRNEDAKKALSDDIPSGSFIDPRLRNKT